ncbi:carbohydrate binding domain-containing protein [Micromonospora sp. NBC_01796]|uniref:carbohydrate binding domain-containing protein n=1 Tax=Micromonospora sp. NBC_01796 TaxID=2975987 RepID=UPI002DD81791|nr:carbohydrate binding domain-containing protein [Micromonospora sp. NBC_01796]WSA83600.1 carbohydrate binding domain-containing protein [Micromonospora sp. NBC_01796]
MDQPIGVPIRRPVIRHRFGGLLRALLATVVAATPLVVAVGPQPASAAPANGNLIINGTFDNGSTQPWWTRLSETRTDVQAGQLRIRTLGERPNTWDDLVGHFEFGVEAGRRYRLQFDANTDVGRTLRVSVSRANTPFTSAFDRNITLGSAMTRFTFDFTSPFADAQAVLFFHLGDSVASTVRLDNISLTPLPADAATDPVLFWNDQLLAAYRVARDGVPPTSGSRIGAIMHAAMWDAAVSVTGTGQPYRARVPVHYPGTLDDVVAPSLEAAINQAARDTLVALFANNAHPGVDPARFDAALTQANAQLPAGVNGSEVARGTSVGAQAATAILQARAGDGSGVNTPYTLDGVRGSWRPTEPGTSAVTPNWGRVTPFAMTRSNQFRPGPPAGAANYADLLGKQEYLDRVDEVRRLGGRQSTERTADQTQIAFFWANDVPGTYKPPGQLYAHTRIVAEPRGLGILGNARLFGLVSLAMADAAIAAWDAKYETGIDLWRPETAIQEIEPGWKPLSQRPNGVSFSPAFPAYISGHATFAGAWAGVMRAYFGTDAIPFTGTTEDPSAIGVRRSFATFTQAAQENARSRIYLGVHYQWDADAGIATGTSVAARVFSTQLRP